MDDELICCEYKKTVEGCKCFGETSVSAVASNDGLGLAHINIDFDLMRVPKLNAKEIASYTMGKYSEGMSSKTLRGIIATAKKRSA